MSIAIRINSILASTLFFSLAFGLALVLLVLLFIGLNLTDPLHGWGVYSATTSLAAFATFKCSRPLQAVIAGISLRAQYVVSIALVISILGIVYALSSGAI
jgi:hypothetical protein